MAAITNKQQFLNQVLNLLKKKYDLPADPEPRTVLEHLVYAICREGATRAQAEPAFRRLRQNFFDWNDVRVSSPREVAESLAGLPNAPARAQRIIGLLQEIFETTFSFDLEELDKKGLKRAATQLGRYKDVDDYALAWVIQQALGGHAIPLDAPAVRVLRRLGVVEEEPESIEALRGSVEHAVPKARGPAFVELISRVAHVVCWEENPNCKACPLRSECPTGQERLRGGADAPKAGPRLKSR
ncbi:MAG TPA: hypothetical protein VIL46_01405 [Gemmataceae bacterium]